MYLLCYLQSVLESIVRCSPEYSLPGTETGSVATYSLYDILRSVGAWCLPVPDPRPSEDVLLNTLMRLYLGIIQLWLNKAL